MALRYLLALGPQSGEGSNLALQPLGSDSRYWSNEPGIDLSGKGRIFGHLFARVGARRRITSLDARESLRILRSGGQALLDDYWGSYVAILMPASDSQLLVLRDPSANLPCLMRRVGHHLLLASDTALLGQWDGPAIQPDYLSIARLLSGVDQMGRKTCLSGIDELMPGEQLTWRDGTVGLRMCWSPWPFVEQALPPGDIAELLADRILGCTASWASCFDHIALGVSGGLDSSSVAAGVRRSEAVLRCLTMIGPDPDGDESRFAQQLCAHLGLGLLVVPYQLAEIDITRPTLAHLPWPVGSLFVQGILHAHAALRAQGPIDAYFAGNGGDGVFSSLRSAAPLVDRFRAEGPGAGCLATLRDVSDLTGASMRTVLTKAGKRLIQRDTGLRPRRDLQGLHPAIAAQLGPRASLHPWLRDAGRHPAGKWAHVAMISRSHRSMELHPRTEAPQIAPLLSQPIVELCLAIPS